MSEDIHENLSQVKEYFTELGEQDVKSLYNSVVNIKKLTDDDYIKLIFHSRLRSINHIFFESISATNFYHEINSSKVRISFCLNRKNDDHCALITLMDESRTNNRIASVASAIHRQNIKSEVPSLPDLLNVVEFLPSDCSLSSVIWDMLSEEQKEDIGQRQLFMLIRSFAKSAEEYDNLDVSSQILLTLDEMEILDILHSDLHADQIVIKKMNTPIQLKYASGTIRSMYVPMIYDWISLSSGGTKSDYESLLKESQFLPYEEAINNIPNMIYGQKDQLDVTDYVIETDSGSNFNEEIGDTNMFNVCLIYFLGLNKDKNFKNTCTAIQINDMIAECDGSRVKDRCKLTLLFNSVNHMDHITKKDRQKLISRIQRKMKTA